MWKLHTDSKHPVSRILRLKYMKGESLCSLQEIYYQNGTVTWNLCKRSHNLFKNNLFRIPGRGNKTLLWKDSIMVKPPLDTVEGINCIRNWMKLGGVSMLADISSWDVNGGWLDGSLPRIPHQAKNKKSQFLIALSDLAPVHLQEKDH